MHCRTLGALLVRELSLSEDGTITIVQHHLLRILKSLVVQQMVSMKSFQKVEVSCGLHDFADMAVSLLNSPRQTKEPTRRKFIIAW
jgi:hypothetical protein